MSPIVQSAIVVNAGWAILQLDHGKNKLHFVKTMVSTKTNMLNTFFLLC